jgi:hypothetical protein
MLFGPYLVILGAVVNVVGSLFYLRDTFVGKVKPNKITFLLWAAAPLIGGVAAVARGVTWAAVPVFIAGLLPLVILIVSFGNPKAYWKLNKIDYVHGGLSVLALVLWAVTNEPIVAIIFAILSDFFAALPTLTKTWRHPETENGWAYLASSFNGLTGVIAVSVLTFEQIAFPLYLFIMMGLIGIVALRRPISNNPSSNIVHPKAKAGLGGAG